jgi:hypothetical protein
VGRRAGLSNGSLVFGYAYRGAWHVHIVKHTPGEAGRLPPSGFKLRHYREGRGCQKDTRDASRKRARLALTRMAVRISEGLYGKALEERLFTESDPNGPKLAIVPSTDPTVSARRHSSEQVEPTAKRRRNGASRSSSPQGRDVLRESFAPARRLEWRCRASGIVRLASRWPSGHQHQSSRPLLNARVTSRRSARARDRCARRVAPAANLLLRRSR